MLVLYPITIFSLFLLTFTDEAELLEEGNSNNFQPVFKSHTIELERSIELILAKREKDANKIIKLFTENVLVKVSDQPKYVLFLICNMCYSQI